MEDRLQQPHRVVVQPRPGHHPRSQRRQGRQLGLRRAASRSGRSRTCRCCVLGSYIDTELKENVEIGSTPATFSPTFALAASTLFCNGVAPTAAAPVVPICAATAGKRVTETPKLQFGGRAEYTVGPVSVGAQAKWVGSRFATDTNDVKVKGYALVDLDARVSLLPVGLDRSYFQLNVRICSTRITSATSRPS